MNQQRVSAALKWGIGLVGAVIISPYVFMAVQGLVGLILALGIGFVAISLAPWFATFVTNLGMKLFIGEVAANPIESLKNLQIEKHEELGNMRNDIVAFDGELASFKKQVKQVKVDYPEEAAEYDQMVAEESEALNQMRELYEDAKADVESLAKDINKAEALFALALSALKVSKLNKSQKAKVFQDIKKKVAFDTVDKKVAMSFAALRGSVLARKNKPLELPAPKVEVVDLGKVAQRIRVQ